MRQEVQAATPAALDAHKGRWPGHPSPAGRGCRPLLPHQVLRVPAQVGDGVGCRRGGDSSSGSESITVGPAGLLLEPVGARPAQPAQPQGKPAPAPCNKVRPPLRGPSTWEAMSRDSRGSERGSDCVARRRHHDIAELHLRCAHPGGRTVLVRPQPPTPGSSTSTRPDAATALSWLAATGPEK